MNGNLSLFGSVFALIFVAELPDKTAFATLLLATQNKPLPVFLGACLAFVIQSIVAIFAGNLFGLLPHALVHRVAGILFLVFAFMALRRKSELDDGTKLDEKGFWKTLIASFLVIFIAEWGDLTQLATAVLEARYHSPFILFTAATSALCAVTGIAVILGSFFKKKFPAKVLNGVAAFVLTVVGLLLLFEVV